jgi:hypothetical protein
VATRERQDRLEELFAAGWTTELFAEFWKAPDLEYTTGSSARASRLDLAQFQGLVGA